MTQDSRCSCGGYRSRARLDDEFGDELELESPPRTGTAPTPPPARAPAPGVPMIRFVTLQGYASGSRSGAFTPAAHDPIIKRIAHLVIASPLIGAPIKDIRLVGHAHDGVDDAASRILGTKRAENARQRLKNAIDVLGFKASSRVNILISTRGKADPLVASAPLTSGVNRRVDVYLPRNCQTFLAQYDLQSMPGHDVLGVPAHPNIADKARRMRLVREVVDELTTRLIRRAGDAAAGRPPVARPLDPVADAALRAKVVELSDMQVKLFRDYLPGPAPAGVDFQKLKACFWKFAGGELRTPHREFAGEGVGEPEGGLFFLFAEFAFLCAESGIDQAVWEPALNAFVGGQEIFMHVYHPKPAAPPPVGFALPAFGPALTTLDLYDFTNFKRTGKPVHIGVGQSSAARKIDLLAKYRSMGIAQLRAAASENLLRAQRMRAP